MTLPLFSVLHCARLALVSLSLVACVAAWAQPVPSAVAAPTPSGHVLAKIQAIPRPVGTAADRYKHVDAAIAVIQSSGLRYEVHGLGTVVEGPPEKIWPLLQAVHQATLEAGVEHTLSIIKVSNGAEAGGPRVEDLNRKFRNRELSLVWRLVADMLSNNPLGQGERPVLQVGTQCCSGKPGYPTP